jgi:hypothetical protein
MLLETISFASFCLKIKTPRDKHRYLCGLRSDQAVMRILDG